jgi:hypothetical protein
MFNDAPFRVEQRLAAVNSINWARVAAQIPYYAYAALALGAPDRPVAFSVPTGNFGNVFAAWAVKRMGLPIERLLVGANRNDILARFLLDNDMSVRGVEPSLSPSMDIQVSSNFERLLFELLDRDPAATEAQMLRFRAEGRMPVPDAAWQKATGLFAGSPWTTPAPWKNPTPQGERQLPRGPAHRDRHRRRPRPGAGRPVHPGRGRRHRPPGQVPGRGGAGHRRASPPASGPRRPIWTGRALFRARPRPVRGRGRRPRPHTPQRRRLTTASAKERPRSQCPTPSA